METRRKLHNNFKVLNFSMHNFISCEIILQNKDKIRTYFGKIESLEFVTNLYYQKQKRNKTKTKN